MKQPIKPAEMRIGDLVRCEAIRGVLGDNVLATEFRTDAEFMGGIGDIDLTGVRYFLLDRPEPAVELPTTPTLGWIQHRVAPSPAVPSSILAHWEQEGVWLNSHDGRGFRREHVTAFIPATAVPSVALDELRAALNRHRTDILFDLSNEADEVVERFINAIDEAANT